MESSKNRTSERYDPWYVKVAFGLFLCTLVGTLTVLSADVPLPHFIVARYGLQSTEGRPAPGDAGRFRSASRSRQRASALTISRQLGGFDYLSCVEMLLNVVLRFVPSVLTATMMATEMPAAIKPYSIAVAAD
jgi:hypothetical protein